MRKVSNKKLEELEIHYVGSKAYPNKYYCTTLNEDIIIPEYYSIEDILKIIYDRAFKFGEAVGKETRSREIRDLLGYESVI